MMYGLNQNIIDGIIKTIKTFESIEEVYLFGSRARGDFNDKSDIDLAVNSNKDVTLKLKRELEEIRCIYTFDVVDMNFIGEKLKENIERDKVCIYKK